VIARVIDIKMRADQGMDIVGLQAKQSQLLHHIRAIFKGGNTHVRWGLKSLGKTAIDQDVLTVIRLYEIARHWHSTSRNLH
jgi:hypothetical protein